MSQGNRVVRVDLGGDRGSYRYTLGLGPAVAAKQRADADTNHDGKVSDAEGRAALERLGRQLAGSVSVCTGRDLPTVHCKKLDAVERSHAVGWNAGKDSPLELEWDFGLDLAGAGALRISDAWKFPGIARTDVIIAPGARHLSRAGPEEGKPGVVTHFGWRDELRGDAPRTLVVTWPAPPSHSRWIALALAALLALGLGGVLWKRRRNA